MSQYHPLSRWLDSLLSNEIALTFQQVELILGFPLPRTARERPQWWANEASNTRHVQCNSWTCAGFRVKNLDRAKESVVFERA